MPKPDVLGLDLEYAEPVNAARGAAPPASEPAAVDLGQSMGFLVHLPVELAQVRQEPPAVASGSHGASALPGSWARGRERSAGKTSSLSRRMLCKAALSGRPLQWVRRRK